MRMQTITFLFNVSYKQYPVYTSAVGSKKFAVGAVYYCPINCKKQKLLATYLILDALVLILPTKVGTFGKK